MIYVYYKNIFFTGIVPYSVILLVTQLTLSPLVESNKLNQKFFMLSEIIGNKL